jgi:uncharacterized protein (DUF1501 family)
MLDVGSFSARDCDGLSRRAFLKASSVLPFALGVGSAGARAAVAPQAKSVLLLWLWGGPSHIDTFDPKPDAPDKYRGPFGTIPTRTPGVHFSEFLPKLARRSDRFSLIRSMVSSNGGHPGAGTVGLTGFEDQPTVHPNFGSIVAKHRSQSGKHDGHLPPFLSVGHGIPRDLPKRIKGYGGGTLGKAYDPFQVRCSETGNVDIPTLKLLDDLTPSRIRDRRRLMAQLSDAQRRVESAEITEWNQAHNAAFHLLTNSEALNAFDLTQEAERTREAYGQTTFGQSCLLGRRLVEAGVPYVQVNWSEYVEAMSPGCDFGWDTHIYNFELLQDRHCPIFDRVFSALLDDMRDRGLLDSTLVVAMGEFGRTPEISKRAAREHWKHCYFSVWAGAGIEPGRVIGESDAVGEHPVTRKITPLMAGTTIAELAGIHAQERAELKVLDGGSVIHELL